MPRHRVPSIVASDADGKVSRTSRTGTGGAGPPFRTLNWAIPGFATGADKLPAVSAIPYCDDVLDSSVSLFQLADVAKNVGLPVSKVHQLLRDHKIIAVKRHGVLGVPEEFFGSDGQIVKWLPGLLAVLHDGGYTDIEILRWLYLADESLPGRPVDALHGHLAREIIRRAQAMAF